MKELTVSNAAFKKAYGDSLPYSMVKRLVKSGCRDINMITNIAGDTLLHRVVRENDLTALNILLAAKDINLNAENGKSETALYIALRNYFEKVSKIPRDTGISSPIHHFSLWLGVYPAGARWGRY